ncbi:alginate O-acetyltransferase AlgX-related protein [Tumidithrix helvetica PCC 7403]|uniref:alginate O-acetyltransferase AlgX-related protein n=1 Tax=Tumidithrix helvetica TaxID=3457545 RepID=UPI003C8CCC66
MNQEKSPRIFDNLLIVTFIIGLFLPLVLTHNRHESAIEKRKLAAFPELKWERKTVTAFPSQFEAFFNDHFGLRDRLVQLYSLYSILLKSSSNPKVLLGLDDWLFYINPDEGNSLEDYRRNDPLTLEELSKWKTSLEAKYRWLKQQGIPYLFAIVPDKYSIYPEYMPSHIRQVGRQTRLDQLLDYMKGSEVPILDLRPVLLQAKHKGQLFYKTDTHWNEFGAAIAQHEIIRNLQLILQKRYPDLIPINYSMEDFEFTEYKSGDIANMLNISYLLKEMVPKLREPLPLCNKYILEERSEDPMKATFFTECRTNAPKALIFRDSFFIVLQPYISQYLAKSVYVWEWPNLKLLKKYLEYNHPDIVIEERVERHLKFITNF